jgi:hypothetical protein
MYWWWWRYNNSKIQLNGIIKFTCLSPITYSPSMILSQSNLSASPFSKSLICSYLIGRKASTSKPNFSCSVPILKNKKILIVMIYSKSKMEKRRKSSDQIGESIVSN